MRKRDYNTIIGIFIIIVGILPFIGVNFGGIWIRQLLNILLIICGIILIIKR